MTPGVAANVREVLSSSLRSWIIESLEHFGVDSRVFLHVIQSILEEDVRSLRGEDALDDPWRCHLASVGSKRGGRDPKRQMNEDNLRRCVLLENMRACFKEDEFDVAEEFVDELLNRWTEEGRMNVDANGGMKNSSQDLREEMDDEENKEMKDPVREYNEAFPALGAGSLHASPASQTEHAFETTGRQNRNCAELLRELFNFNASSRNPENDCSKESMRSSTETAKRCREVAKSMARDFVNSSVVANTQQNDFVSLRSNEFLGHSNVVPDLSRRFFANKLRATDISAKDNFTVSAELALEDSYRRLSLPSSHSDSVQELNSHLAEMSKNTCPAQRECSKFFPPLPPEVLSRTVERILSQGRQDLPCCHVPLGSPNTGASHGCIQCCYSRRLDVPIYTENEFGMLVRLGEDCSLVEDERTDQKGYGKGVIDASHLVVGVGKDVFPVSSDTLSTGAKEKTAEEVDLPLSGGLLGSVLPDQGSSEIKGGHPDWLRHPCTATSGMKGAREVLSLMHQTEQQRGENVGSCDHSAALGPGLFFCSLSCDTMTPETREGLLNSDGLCLTGKTQPSATLPTLSRSKIVSTNRTATASQLKPSEPNDFQCFGEIDEMSTQRCWTASADDLQRVSIDLADASLAGRTKNQPNIGSRNAEPSSSATISCRLGNDGALASHGAHERDSSSAVSCETVLRLLADVIERDLMNHIAASLIPLFPDLSTPQDLFLPDAEMLANIAVQNCIPEPNCDATVGSNAFRVGMCENDYALYLRLAVRQENLHVDHVLNFQDFCRWRQCLLQQAGSGENVSCICELCHRALRHLADSRYAFVDVDAARLEADSERALESVADSERALERESLLVTKSEHKELQSGKQGPDKRDDSGSHFSSKPAFVRNACLQNSSAGTGDFTGKFDGIIMDKVSARKDGNYGCSSVGEGDVLLQKHCQIDNVGVYGRNSLREIWPDGDADRKSEECCGLKEHFEENNNVLESFGWLPESGFFWPSSQGVAVGNSVNIWLNSGTSLASATSCKKAMSAMKSCDKTVLRDFASDKSISAASKHNTAEYSFDFGASAASVCDKVASADPICNKSANVCNRPSLPASFRDRSALITNSFDESSLTASSCHNWYCTDIAETVTAAISSIAPSESKVECLSPSMQMLEKLLSSEEDCSSSVESFRSALHDDFYSLWLNTSPTHGHESGPLYAEETSSDCGSQSLGSDGDDDALHNAEAHYEADISSSDSSLDEGSLREHISDMQLVEVLQKSTAEKEHLPSEAQILFGLSFSMPSEPSSFSPVGIEDIVSTKHSKFQSSQSSIGSSEATDTSESNLSKPYSAACNSSGEHLVTAEECKGLLSDWDQRQPHLESYEGPAADCYWTDSEDLEEPMLYKSWEECSSENFGKVIPAWDANLPDSRNFTGLTFSCVQQEVIDLEKFEKLKSIWDESQLDNLKDTTAGCEPQESGLVNLKEASFCETFRQLHVQDVKRLLPSSDMEHSASKNYRKLSSLWDTDQAKVQSFGGLTTFWENTDLDNSRVLAPSWNQQAPEFEHGSGMTPDWNMNEHAQENSKVLKIDWNEQEPQTEGAKDGILNWNILHEPSAESCTDLTSYWGQQQSRVQNLKGPILVSETVRSGSENAVALALDSNQEESDSGNLTNLASLKSLWKEEEPCPSSSNGLKGDWDLNERAADCALGLALSCGHQTADLGSCKDLTELKSIWEEKEPCSASSKGVKQNWEMNQLGANLRNPEEVQQTWDENQPEADNLLDTASNCDQQEADSRNVQNLRFIWEDAPSKSENLKGVTSCSKPQSTTLKKLMPSSDNNRLKPENLVELCATSNDHQAANLENSKDIWEVDENPNGLTSSWDQQELWTENTVRPESSSLHATSDLDNCMLLTSIWERRQSESGRTSCWEVLESRSEGNAVETVMPTNCDMNHKVVAECARNDVGDFQNLAQSLQKGKQKNLESLMGGIWEMNPNPNDGETGGVGQTYNCNPEENDTETFQNLTHLESLWGERESNLENLRGAELNWDTAPSETKNLMKLAPSQDQEDAGPDSFPNLAQLKSIWDEKLPDSENVEGLMLDWDTNQTDGQYATRRATDQGQQEADQGNFQNLAQLKSIWEEKEPDLESSKGAKLNWDMNRLETQHAVVLPSCPNPQETDPGNFLNLSEVKSIWEGKQSSSENLEKLASCWENQAPELENMTWGDTSQPSSESLIMLNSGSGPCDNDCQNLKSIWEGQQPGMGNLKGPTSCWKKQGVKSEILNAGPPNWNMTHLNSESFDNSLFDLNCRKLESENFESVMSSHGEIKQSNSEICLDRKLPEPKCFRRPTSDRELRYQEFGGLTTSNADLWQSDSDELKQMISRWDKQHTESRGIRGLFSHFDPQQSNLAAEWQLAEAVNQLKTSADASSSLWRLAGRNQDNVLPKLVPSENSAFQDEIPRRFVYRYAFFDPRDVHRSDLATKDARTETIRHIYEPSNSIVRQLEDLFDDGQRLHTEEALTNLPNCLFRPIGEQNSGRDSHQSVAASVGLALDVGDLSLQIKSPSTDPSEVVEPNSPYQLYLGVESQTFVPRFRVHKELEKSAQTGEATPPMQNNECVFGMNVILSTIALLE